MTTPDERRRGRLDEETTLARRLAMLHARKSRAVESNWNTAAFHHCEGSVDNAFAATEYWADGSLRVHLVQVGGSGAVAGVLLAQCCLEILRRTESVDLAELNRYFLGEPAGERTMIAAGTLRFDGGDSTWLGSFAGLRPPILFDGGGDAEFLRGSGPFLGLIETTFPVLRGRLGPGERLIALAGSGAGGPGTELLGSIADSERTRLPEWIDRLGLGLVSQLEPGLGLTLVGVDRGE